MENIYRLITSEREYKRIDYGDTPLVHCLVDDLWDKEILESYQFKWNSDDVDKTISDCPFLIGAIPVIKSEIIKQMNLVIPEEYLKTININVSGEKYSILRAQKTVKGLLNLRKSAIDYYSDGRIMYVDKYVLNSKKELPIIFRLDEYPLYTFTTEVFAMSLMDLQPMGMFLEKCEIRKPFLFF